MVLLLLMFFFLSTICCYFTIIYFVFIVILLSFLSLDRYIYIFFYYYCCCLTTFQRHARINIWWSDDSPISWKFVAVLVYFFSRIPSSPCYYSVTIFRWIPVLLHCGHVCMDYISLFLQILMKIFFSYSFFSLKLLLVLLLLSSK